jgi:hypothetical protein
MNANNHKCTEMFNFFMPSFKKRGYGYLFVNLGFTQLCCFIKSINSKNMFISGLFFYNVRCLHSFLLAIISGYLRSFALFFSCAFCSHA